MKKIFSQLIRQLLRKFLFWLERSSTQASSSSHQTMKYSWQNPNLQKNPESKAIKSHKWSKRTHKTWSISDYWKREEISLNISTLMTIKLMIWQIRKPKKLTTLLNSNLSCNWQGLLTRCILRPLWLWTSTTFSLRFC